MRKCVAGTCVWIAVMLAGARPSAAAAEIVLYASDAANLHGNWSRASDATTAGGQLMTSVDNGWADPNAPFAWPGHYFEFTFTAPANTPYRIWLRLRAGGNSKLNDSVFVQLSDAIDSQGSGIYRIGTTSALAENLQTCDGCALSGWGWVGGAYWLTQQATVSFASTGTHTLRIQAREDGVQLDEIVLSPSAYLSASPGQAVNDATRIFKGGASTSTPFSGAPAPIPGTIQLENFDNGGEGVRHDDTTSGNAGGAFRTGDVDIEAQKAARAATTVGRIAAGEWLNYTVNVASVRQLYGCTGLRVASPNGALMHVRLQRRASSVWQAVCPCRSPARGRRGRRSACRLCWGPAFSRCNASPSIPQWLNIASVTIVSRRASPVPPPYG